MRSLFRPLAVLAMTGGMVVASALPAWAHYPMVSGTQTCASGQYVVTWMVKNSESAQTMTVDQVSVTAGTVVGLTGVYAGSASRTATTTLPGTTKTTVTLSVHGTWPDRVQATRTASVALQGDCKPAVTTTTTSSTTTTTTRPPPTTTSSSTTTTTTEPPATTTSSSSTTSTAPTSTSTTAPPPNTTTTADPTTTTTTAPTTTTTAAPTTSTTVKTEVQGKTETKAPTTTTTTVKTEVLGEHVTKPAPGGALPHTGVAVGLLAFIGGGLLWIGLPLSRYKRRKDED